MTDFVIKGLAADEFSHLFKLNDEELKKRHMVRMTCDEFPGFPCRVSMVDAEVGESVLLLNYEHQKALSPYRSRHAIFVREQARGQAVFKNEVPLVLSRRLLSVRAFDEADMITSADVVDGDKLAAKIEEYFADSSVRYLHVHNAKRGCFAARVERLQSV